MLCHPIVPKAVASEPNVEVVEKPKEFNGLLVGCGFNQKHMYIRILLKECPT
jgi:hypothetical protein